MWSSKSVIAGDTVLVINDQVWGKVLSTNEEGVLASYDSDTFMIMWEDIASIRRNGNDITPSTPLPHAPDSKPTQPVDAAAMAVANGVDLDAQRKIAPGHIVTWGHAQRHRYHEHRLFVVLNYTKNSNGTMVNIYPLNGVQPGEGGRDAASLQWYKVMVSNCQPVAFPAPLIKRKVGN